ncbi:hypothetical protein E3U25_03945 (plasmid) [Paracoccus versutus]|nr:hypothetical protein E3U25_03945 [Paracoccus versutus]
MRPPSESRENVPCASSFDPKVAGGLRGTARSIPGGWRFFQARRRGNHRPRVAFRFRPARERIMKGIIAWLLGVPIFVIILLYLTGIF